MSNEHELPLDEMIDSELMEKIIEVRMKIVTFLNENNFPHAHSLPAMSAIIGSEVGHMGFILKEQRKLPDGSDIMEAQIKYQANLMVDFAIAVYNEHEANRLKLVNETEGSA